MRCGFMVAHSVMVSVVTGGLVELLGVLHVLLQPHGSPGGKPVADHDLQLIVGGRCVGADVALEFEGVLALRTRQLVGRLDVAHGHVDLQPPQCRAGAGLRREPHEAQVAAAEVAELGERRGVLVERQGADALDARAVPAGRVQVGAARLRETPGPGPG